MQTKLLREIKIALPNLRKSEVKVAEFILNKPSAIIELTTARAVVNSIMALGLFNINSATFTSDFLKLGSAILISLNNLVCIKVRIGFLD